MDIADEDEFSFSDVEDESFFSDFEDESLYVEHYSGCFDKSTLCPADLDNYCDQVKPPSSSLTHLCCVQVSRYAQFLVNDGIYLPSNVYEMLMMEAIRENLCDCAAFFMSTWPLKTISMIDVIPYHLAAFAQPISRFFLAPGGYKSLTAIVLFLRLCLDVLRRGLTPSLRVLDLRGWVLSDAMTNYFIREIVSLYPDVRLLHNYHVFIECKIVKSRTYDELMTLFEMNGKSRKNKIHLHIKKLDLCLLKREKAIELLQLIEPTELIGLATSLLSNKFLTSVFTKFFSLTTLLLDESSSDRMRQQLPLHLLPHLRRLGLSTVYGDIPTCIPKSTLKQLDYLNMHDSFGFATTRNDLCNLTTLPLHLRELNLSCHCMVAAHAQLWRKLLLSLAPTLLILVLEHCILCDDHFGCMVSFILPLTNLIFLDLNQDAVTIEGLCEHVPKLESMQQLKEIALSYPKPNYNLSETADEAKLIKLKCKTLKQRLATKTPIPIKIEWYIGSIGAHESNDP